MDPIIEECLMQDKLYWTDNQYDILLSGPFSTSSEHMVAAINGIGCDCRLFIMNVITLRFRV